MGELIPFHHYLGLLPTYQLLRWLINQLPRHSYYRLVHSTICSCLSVSVCLYVFVCVCVSLSACLPGCRSCLSVCLSVACLPICLSVCLSFRFSVISSMNYLPFTKFAFANHFILVLLINLISSYVKEPQFFVSTELHYKSAHTRKETGYSNSTEKK